MSLRTYGVLAIASLLIAACDSDPIVEEFNGDSVRISTPLLADDRVAVQRADAEANRLCASRGRKADLINVRDSEDDDLFEERLYACI